jgi:hypothetical protein
VSAPVLLETAAGIQWDFARNPAVVQALGTIAFPDYFADVLGVAKCLALAALLAPGLPRLKEWAYAGITFVYLGATVCHAVVGDVPGADPHPTGAGRAGVGVLGTAPAVAARPPPAVRRRSDLVAALSALSDRVLGDAPTLVGASTPP